ncbi:MAG: hypothetical protein ACI9GZ_004473 [Bacteroidia bacterium]|jgi:hypothetical protein
MYTIAKYLFPLILLYALNQVRGEFSIILYELGTAVAFVYYLNLGTQNKTHLKAIAISIAALPLIQTLAFWELFNQDFGQWLIYIGACSTTAFYFLRFWKKSERWFILEILKFLAIIQFSVLYSIDSYELGRIAISILGFVYLSTRFFQHQNLSTMSRNVVSGLLIVGCIFFFIFGYLKSDMAEKEREYSMEAYNKVQEREQDINKQLYAMEHKIDSIQLELSKCQNGE